MKKKHNEKYGIIIFSNGTIIGRSGKQVSGEIDKDGYRRIGVSYYENGIRKRKHMFVHRLVALAFIGNRNDNTLVVNHKDSNKLNNDISNLEFVSVKYNTNHAIHNGRCEHMVQGEQNIFTKYPDELISKIYDRLKTVERYDNGNIKAGELIKIANELGVTRHVVKNYSRKREIRTYLK